MVLAFIDIIPERDIGKSFFFIKFIDSLYVDGFQLALNDELACSYVYTLYNEMNELNQFQGN